MASTLTRILIHVVFSTKDRQPFIPRDHMQALFAYFGGICRGNKCVLEAAGGMPDHVHLLVSMAKTIALSDLLMQIKRDSSAWVKTQEWRPREFGWQDGYAALSIGASQVAAVRKYLANQAEHHRVRSFREELVVLLDRYGVEYDPRYVFA
jgi:REP element-mobilizing transposase RayT